MLLAFFFLSDRSTCGILVPRPGIEPMPPPPNIGSMASSPLDHQGNPLALTFKIYLEFVFFLPPLSCPLSPTSRLVSPTSPPHHPHSIVCGHWSWGARALPVAHPTQPTAVTTLSSAPTTHPLPTLLQPRACAHAESLQSCLTLRCYGP